mmetsp:Transcript_32842/g.38012  ORF Transcript_32842/g.38012 Transcript_32842/m.38012 type:complete len:119 (+) Transcript_32842:144-500(+)|eukprot:CAMPEP_0171295172 /NCGR_PEP_ID=MMETSP0816-20121228/3784_1 /TAXON_ID=420281 /ORGANISM="Proboscia inermis, Strain CCAP1064/1" /LENGTH=118 /DNA_ID=CAMNT_0011767655 /DNA_START=61 /DNA_END=417 /DNA_ORIENTATION=+
MSSSGGVAAASTSNSNENNAISEVEETMARISSHKGVEGVIILTRDGATIQSSLNDEQTATHAALLSQLALKAASVVETLDMSDELTFLRLRSRNREVMIAPDKDYLLVVIQNPNATE